LEKPVQVVHRHARLMVAQHDWRARSLAWRETELGTFLKSEGRRGFTLTTPPLLRLTLIRWDDDTYRMVLAHHHLLLDGWCKPALFRELFDTYEAHLCDHRPDLPPVRPYRDYILWLQQQDLAKAEAFWRTELAGFRGPTRLTLCPLRQGTPPPADDYMEHHVELTEAVTSTLRSLVRAERVTLNSLVQGLWGIVLSGYGGGTDVVFGATVSGRPAALNGADSMLGLFINTLPVRLRVPAGQALFPWLRDLQARQMEAREFDYTPLVEIQRWSELPKGEPLFETILVFENNVGYGCGWERYGTVEIGDVRPVIRNSFPLTVRVVPGAGIARMGEEFTGLLGRIAQQPDATVDDLCVVHRTWKERRLQAEQEALRTVGAEKLKRVRRRAVSGGG
jgi:hypothetical protein